MNRPFSVCIKVNTLCCKIFYSFAALTRKILFNTEREISYFHTTMQYPLFNIAFTWCYLFFSISQIKFALFLKFCPKDPVGVNA